MKELVLKNSEWLRGTGLASTVDWPTQGSALLTTDGRRCCLGVHAQACGFPDSALLGRGTPWSIPEREVLTPDQRAYKAAWRMGGTDAAVAIRINDVKGLTDVDRVALLQPLFRAHGVRLVFDPSA